MNPFRVRLRWQPDGRRARESYPANGISVIVARKFSVTVFALLMASAIPAGLVESAAISIGLVSLAMLGLRRGCVVLLRGCFSNEHRTSIRGLASMGSGLGGMMFALLTGWVRHSYSPVLIGFGLMPVICHCTLLHAKLCF